MAHSCPICMMACYCDMEDHDQEAPDDCIHCEGEDDNDEPDYEPHHSVMS